jgi:hypothetical protein
VLEPQATIDFLGTLTLSQVGQVRNLSPYALSPILWAFLVVGGVALTLRLAPTRWGWAAAVALSILATPRLLSYMLMTFLAALGGERRTEAPLAATSIPASAASSSDGAAHGS